MEQQIRTPSQADGTYGPAMGAPTTEGGGWLTFSAVIFMLAAASSVLYGISALVNDDYFAVDELLFGDLAMWGVFFLVLSALQLATALLILARRPMGAVLGIGLASVHAIVVLASIGAYPLWSTVLLILDGLVIYGLCVYGFQEAE